jgi:hypothetical protein
MSDQDLAAELNAAVADLQDALQRAADATARIKGGLPHLTRISSVFGELESIIAAGRREGSAPATPIAPPAARTRPALLAPDAPVRAVRPAEPTERIETAPQPDPIIAPPSPANGASAEWQTDVQPAPVASPQPDAEPAIVPAAQVANEPTTTFRLEFQSSPGPLDLRAVDDAVSQHPAVRDVALIDYDGRRATLKVWIVATTTPAEVQETLAARTAQMASNGSEISIVALEDAA